MPDQLQSGKDWTAIVQQRWQELINERCKNIPGNIDDINNTGYDEEPLAKVKIIDKAYLTAKFKARVEKEQNIIDNAVSAFLLNTEQERAFYIIANHASTQKPEQLIMYVGGMAGTGQSQVIKSLTESFGGQNESHWIIIAAPTGAAAALIRGSTYHSILGINDKGASNTSMEKVRTRLDGVIHYVGIGALCLLFKWCHTYFCYDWYQELQFGPTNYTTYCNSPKGSLISVVAGYF